MIYRNKMIDIMDEQGLSLYRVAHLTGQQSGFRNLIGKIMDEQGINPYEIGDRIGQQYPGSIYQILERNYLDHTELSTLDTLAKVLGVGIDSLYQIENKNENLEQRYPSSIYQTIRREYLDNTQLYTLYRIAWAFDVVIDDLYEVVDESD